MQVIHAGATLAQMGERGGKPGQRMDVQHHVGEVNLGEHSGERVLQRGQTRRLVQLVERAQVDRPIPRVRHDGDRNIRWHIPRRLLIRSIEQGGEGGELAPAIRITLERAADLWAHGRPRRSLEQLRARIAPALTRGYGNDSCNIMPCGRCSPSSCDLNAAGFHAPVRQRSRDLWHVSCSEPATKPVSTRAQACRVWTALACSPCGPFLHECNPSLMDALAAARAYAAQPEAVLLLAGGYGTGKTQRAAAVGNVRLAAGASVLLLVVPDLLDYLRAAFDPNRQNDDESYQVRFEQVRAVDLLILDDLGTEQRTPWALEKWFQIVNHRIGRGVPLVITTNERPDTINPRVRSRGDRRLSQDKVFVLIAPDYCEGRAARPSQDWRTLGGRDDAEGSQGAPFDRGEGAR